MANGTAPTTSAGTARPEAQEPWVLWDYERRAWRLTVDGDTVSDPAHAARFEFRDVEHLATRTARFVRAVPLSQALESGPPVEAKPTTPPDYQADVRAFHEALVPDQVADRPTLPPEHVRALRMDLIEEELNELWAAFREGDLVAVADAIADLLYVTYGTAVACGIDIAPIWREVHRSNMAKEGGPTRADGKILKPEGWTPPDVRGELIRQGWRDPADAATTVQPTPRGTGREITPLVIADLEARTRTGAEKYGEPLRAHNGRDALVDAYQEALDLVQYLRQAIEERGGMPQTGGDDG